MPPGLMRLPNGKLVPRPSPKAPMMMVGPRGHSTPRRVKDPFYSVEQFAKSAWGTVDKAEHNANVRMKQQLQKPKHSWGQLGKAAGFIKGAAESGIKGLAHQYTDPIGGRWGSRQHPTRQQSAAWGSADVPIWPGALPGLSMGNRTLGISAQGAEDVNDALLRIGRHLSGMGWGSEMEDLSIKHLGTAPQSRETAKRLALLAEMRSFALDKGMSPDYLKHFDRNIGTLGLYPRGPYRFPLKFGVEASLAQLLGDIMKYRRH